MSIQYCVYVTRDTTNGKTYVGSHATNDLNDSYLGSGNLIKAAIKKHGRKSFVKTVLEVFDNNDDAYLREAFWISIFNSLHPCGYNISPNGGVMAPGFFSDETRKKMSIANKGRKMPPGFAERLSIMKTGLRHTEESKRKISENKKGQGKGVRQSEEHKKKRFESAAKTRNDKLMALLSGFSDEQIKDIVLYTFRNRKRKSAGGKGGWPKGMKKTEEQKTKIKLKLQGVKFTDEHRKLISEGLRIAYVEGRRRFAKTHSVPEPAKIKMSESAKIRIKNNPRRRDSKGRFIIEG